MPEPARIFVSHSHQDNAFGVRLVQDLRAALGGDESAIWYDVSGGLHGGDEWWRKIVDEITARPIFLMIISPDAMSSHWVMREHGIANNLMNTSKDRKIISILYRPCQPPPDIGVLHWISFLPPRTHEQAFGELLKALGLSGAPAKPPRTQPEDHPKPTKVSRRTVLTGIGMGAGIAAAAIGTYGGVTWLVHQNQSSFGQVSPLTSRLVTLGFTSHVNESLEYVLPSTRTVPAGEFLMGSDPVRDDQAQSNEIPQQSLTPESFEIAQFPVTVAEYAAYVKNGHVAPDLWQTQITRLDNPVVAVTWNEARDYAAWLGSVSGMRWRLVTEAEWEKAARGTDGRRYPWGNNFDTSRANTIESSIGTVTPIGTFPNGASAFGVQDMAGNVWQWTSTLYRPYPYSESDGRGIVQ